MADATTGKPNAADLLARADALMRKNRTPADEDLPVLDMAVEIVDLPAPPARDLHVNWDEVCETVYSRVMQQMDMYSEFGLKERIARDMRPRLNNWAEQFARDFSTELAANMRKYVAQAVDEEVARLRADRDKKK